MDEEQQQQSPPPPSTTTTTTTTTTATASTSASASASAPAPAPAPSEEQQLVASLAHEAESLYKANSYEECLEVLHQLLAKKNDDPKIVLNIGLAEYHRDGLTCAPQIKLRLLLQGVKKKCEELARAVDEQLEGSGNNFVTAYTEDYDATLPTLNLAILQYHNQQYQLALDTLTPLMANIEPLDETYALQVCLVALDITLKLRQARKAATIIRYMEKSYGLAHSSPSESTTANVPTVQTSGPTMTLVGMGSGGLPSPLLNSPSAETSLAQSPVGEETFDEDLMIQFDLEENARVRPPRLPSVGKSSPAPATDLKLLMYFYRVRLLLMTRNLKAAKREIKSALNLSKDNQTALLLKAQLEYLAGNYQKSCKLLTACGVHKDKDPKYYPMRMNDAGCVFHPMHKDVSSTVLFCRTVQHYEIKRPQQQTVSLWTHSEDRSALVKHNSGLHKLLIGEPVSAFSDMSKAQKKCHTRPLYWVRLAECCISALEMGLLPDASPGRKDLKVVVVGQGKWRRLVLPSGSMSPTLREGVSKPPRGGQQPSARVLNLTSARTLLLGAVHRLKKPEEFEVSTAEDKAAEDGTPEFITNSSLLDGKLGNSAIDAGVIDYEAQVLKEKELLMLYAQADLAFVELCIGDPQTVLQYTDKLVTSTIKPFRYLGNVYAAEALCLLGRVKEAQQRIGKCIEETLEEEEPAADTASSAEDKDFSRFSGKEARKTLYVNLAAIHAVQGDLEQARYCAHEARAAAPDNNLATLANVYVDLAEGQDGDALRSLKSFRRLVFTRATKG